MDEGWIGEEDKAEDGKKEKEKTSDVGWDCGR
jgi:hypothetical protein